MAQPCPAKGGVTGAVLGSAGYRKQASLARRGRHPSKPGIKLQDVRPLGISAAWRAGCCSAAAARFQEETPPPPTPPPGSTKRKAGAACTAVAAPRCAGAPVPGGQPAPEPMLDELLLGSAAFPEAAGDSGADEELVLVEAWADD